MIARWLTQRCRDEDVPRASRVRPGLARFLEEQYSRSPLTDPWAGRQRADTWTWHHGDGRGVVWRDRARDVLWLLCFADEHDGGYELGHAPVSADPGEDRLYPRLDPTYAAAGVRGHLAYYAVPNNSQALRTFREEVKRHWLRALRRRSQRTRMTWKRMLLLADRWLPQPRILHPWPDARFDATTQGRSPVR